MAIPERYRDILEAQGFAHWATIGPDGAPQSNPVWIDFDGERILVSQTTTRQKIRNVKRDSRVSLSILDPENPYRYLEIRGEVSDISIDEGNAFINKMAKKYMGAEEYTFDRPGTQRLVVTIVPKHTTHMG
jgi:PPOX class probable F420-dependent enzyme